MGNKNNNFLWQSDFKSEKGASLIIVITIVLILGSLAAIISNLVISENRISILDTNKNQAFYVAEAGLEYSMSLLTDSLDWRATTSDIVAGNGSFSVNVDDSTTIGALDDTLLISVIATTENFVKTLQARAVVGVTETYKNVMLAGNVLDLSTGKGTINGNLHGNDDSDVGNKYTVTGDVTTAPPDITLPVIDWDFFKNLAIAAGQFRTSDIKFKTSDMPITGVWYTTKHIKIESNNVVINGTLVAEQDLEVKKNNTEIFATPEDFPAIIVGHDIKVDFNNTVIEGLIYAENEIVFEKNNGTISGAIIAGNKIIHKGNNLTLNLDPKYTTGVNGIIVNETMLEPADLELISWIEQ